MLRVLAIAELCIFLSYQLWLQFDNFGESETNDAIDDPIFFILSCVLVYDSWAPLQYKDRLHMGIPMLKIRLS